MRDTGKRPQRYIVLGVDRFGYPRAIGSALTLSAAIIDCERNAHDYIRSLRKFAVAGATLPVLRLFVAFDPTNPELYPVHVTVYPTSVKGE